MHSTFGLAALLLLLQLCNLSISFAASRSVTDGRRRTIGGGRVFRRISWETNMTFMGDAAHQNRTISLTTSPADSATGGIKKRGGVGRAYYNQPVRFLDPITRSPASFATRFTFTITPSSSTPIFGDGLAFFIVSDPHRLGRSGGFLGLFSDSGDVRSGEDIIAIEFDTNLDANLRDISDNHVAVDVGSIFSFAAANASGAKVDLREGIPITAWIDYSSRRKRIRIWLGFSFRSPDPVISVEVDLSPRFQEFMYVGFSASDGRGSAAHHLVHRWSFRSFGFASFASPSGIGDLPPRRSRLRSKLRSAICLLVLIILASLILAGVCFLVRRRCRRRRRRRANRGIHRAQEEEADLAAPAADVPARVSIQEIHRATNNFDEGRIIGSGQLGTVYSGVLPSSGCRVAVKRFRYVDAMTAGRFAAELAAVSGGCRHGNLVPLRSWCCEGGDLLLVYDYMPNGTLYHILHGVASTAAPPLPEITWARRRRILFGVAAALVFLHEECERKVIHRNVSSRNVFLDADMNARLGDFELARISDRRRSAASGSSSSDDRRLAGGSGAAVSLGYAAPELLRSGVANEWSDVYAFGVLVLEVVSGRKPLEHGSPLVDWVWNLWRRRRSGEAADPVMYPSIGVDERTEVRRAVAIGLACAYPDRRRRPTMRMALKMLSGAAPPPNLPARRPVVELHPWFSGSSGTDDTIEVPPPPPPPMSSSGDMTEWSTPCGSFT